MHELARLPPRAVEYKTVSYRGAMPGTRVSARGGPPETRSAINGACILSHSINNNVLLKRRVVLDLPFVQQWPWLRYR